MDATSISQGTRSTLGTAGNPEGKSKSSGPSGIPASITLRGDTHTSDPPTRDHPTFGGAEPEHPQPGPSRATAADRSPCEGERGLARPRIFQAAAATAEERSVWAVSVSRSIAGSLPPAPKQRQLHPSPGGRAEVTLLSLFQSRHKAPLLLPARRRAGRPLPICLFGISQAAARWVLQAGTTQTPRSSLSSWHLSLGNASPAIRELHLQVTALRTAPAETPTCTYPPPTLAIRGGRHTCRALLWVHINVHTIWPEWL